MRSETQRVTMIQRLYLWTCERLYAELAWSYDWVSWLVSFGGWSGWQVTVIPYVRGERILEIGFGTGTLLATLAQQGYQVTGLERSATMHHQTDRKLAQSTLNVARVQAPAQQMPFTTNTFDTIISTFPSGYIFDPATLAECARMLRRPTTVHPGGRLVILMSVSNDRTPWQAILQLLSWSQRRSNPGETDRSGPTSENIAEQTTTLHAHFAAAGLQATPITTQRAGATLHLILVEHCQESRPCR